MMWAIPFLARSNPRSCERRVQVVGPYFTDLRSRPSGAPTFASSGISSAVGAS